MYFANGVTSRRLSRVTGRLLQSRESSPFTFRLQRQASTSKSELQWTETKAGELHGITVIGPTPGIVWAHGAGGSCDADDLRGVDVFLSPNTLGRTVLRLDLRGHGRSYCLHDFSRGAEQYTWQAHAKDVRVAAKSAMSRAFFGGEGMGAAIALQAATSAVASGSADAPPGVVLARPPSSLLGEASRGHEWGQYCESIAAAAETQGWGAVEKLEDESNIAVDGIDVPYGSSQDIITLLRNQRRKISPEVYAAVVRGHATSSPLGKEVEALGQTRHDMAGDAYGVPMTLQCPVLLLAVKDDAQRSLEVAQELAALLPNATVEVAANLEEAQQSWGKSIAAFLRKAWMKEFLTKRVMPQ